MEQIETNATNRWLNAEFDQMFISGVDSRAYVYATYAQTEAIELNGLYGVNIATNLDIKPVMGMGRKSISGYTLGTRGIAGSMLFYSAIDSPFFKLQQKIYDKGSFLLDRDYNDDGFDYTGETHADIVPELIPPFGMLLISHIETPIRGKDTNEVYLRYRTLNGVRITGTQRQLNVQNQPVDSYEFIAQDFMTHITLHHPGTALEVNLKQPVAQLKLSNKCFLKTVNNSAMEGTD